MKVADVIGVLQQAGFSGIGLVNALATVLAENPRLDPGAQHVNNDPSVTDPNSAYFGSVDTGLFQINSVTAAGYGYTVQQLMDPITNAKLAFQISGGGGQGFGAGHGNWSTWLNGVPGTLSAAQSYISNLAGSIFTKSGGAPDPGSSPAPKQGPIPTIQVPSIKLPSLPDPGSIPAAIQNVATAIANPFTTIAANLASSVAQVHNLVSWLGQPDLWLRIVLGIIGMLLVLAGLFFFALSLVSPRKAAEVARLAEVAA